MFNLEIEKSIVNFIKKSPIGVTSTDIAKFVGLNRMTITKYLAIIKEKALIDFKQFGMAKLWYIPIDLNKESFFSKTIAYLALNIPKEELKGVLEKSGISLGEDINKMYLGFYTTQKLSFDQICDAFADIGKKLGGNPKVTFSNEKISVEIIRWPFEESNKNAMSILLSAALAKIASLNLGYARALIAEPEKEGNIAIDVYLKKKEESTVLPKL